MMKLINNPYLFGISIAVVEAITNLLISFVLSVEIGENNIPGVLVFILAAAVLAMKTKTVMPRTYNIKVLATYFLIVIILIVPHMLGDAFNVAAAIAVGIFLAFYALVAYALFVFMQKQTVKAILKSEPKKEESNQTQ